MPNEIEQLKQKIERLEKIVNLFTRPDSYIFEKNNIQFKNSKLGFYNTTPVLQPGSPNGKQDKSGSGGANVTDGTGYNGNTGTTYYTIGDIVYSLKILGLID